MKVQELTHGQLTQLKSQMVIDSLNADETKYDFGDIMFPDDVITDGEAFAYYDGTEFVTDDFFA